MTLPRTSLVSDSPSTLTLSCHPWFNFRLFAVAVEAGRRMSVTEVKPPKTCATTVVASQRLQLLLDRRRSLVNPSSSSQRKRRNRRHPRNADSSSSGMRGTPSQSRLLSRFLSRAWLRVRDRAVDDVTFSLMSQPRLISLPHPLRPLSARAPHRCLRRAQMRPIAFRLRRVRERDGNEARLTPMVSAWCGADIVDALLALDRCVRK